MKKWMLVLIACFSFILITACGAGPGEEPEDGLGTQIDLEPAEEEGTEEGVPSEREIAPPEYPQFKDDVSGEEVAAIIHTNMGSIHIKLFPQYAPLAVENFIGLSEEGYYDGVIFHRVIEDFMIQGGDPSGTGTGGESYFGAMFEDEFTTALAHFHGALSMANRGANTNTSQFFIVHAANNLPEGWFEQAAAQGLLFPEETIEKYYEVGGTPHLDFGHTVFGHVIDGMDVVDSIATVETGANDKPVEDVVIESIEILN
ncbi:MAG: peptidylprolyl isomerase [Bacillus sp. (in: Bacteria)]|nr:peptidylprolyl isomerase [Bacillus sp. (in: firmicutes)]